MKKNDPIILLERLKSEKIETNDIFFLMIGEKLDFDVEAFIKLCNENSIEVFGGIFPAVIKNNELYYDEIVVKKIKSDFKPILLRHLNYKHDVREIFEAGFSFEFKQTALIVVDGLSAGINGFLRGLYREFGNTVNYIGGGAGSITLQKKPCVFNNDGIFNDCAVICFVKAPIKLGVKHGWKSVIGPLISTKSKNNVISEINWANPFEVYANAINNDSGLEISKSNFFDVSKCYPFGITKDNNEYVVRDPIHLNDDGSIICVGEIQENSMLDILKGDNDDLISAAREAALETKIDNKSYQIKANMIFDCISRSLFLNDNFKSELQAVTETLKLNGNNLPLEGVLSIGEISSYGNSYLEFFNKTILIGVFYE